VEGIATIFGHGNVLGMARRWSRTPVICR
jgi:TPP-dependent trihydroxycyclohexane-1,2-dione (THcHDO) dehydratase